MRRDDRDDDPFSDIFREIERMMDEMAGEGMGVGFERGPGGFGSDAHVSVYEEDDQVRVVADLPGTDKGDIDVRCDGHRLTVAAATDASEYEERIDLPTRVDEHSAQATFNNGILEVTLARADDAAGIDLN